MKKVIVEINESGNLRVNTEGDLPAVEIVGILEYAKHIVMGTKPEAAEVVEETPEV